MTAETIIDQHAKSAAGNSNTATELEKIFEQHLFMMSVDIPSRISICRTHYLGMHFGNVVITQCDCSGNRVGRRRPDQIREEHADYYMVLVPNLGTTGLSQNGRKVTIPPQSFCFMTARRPFFAFRVGVGESESFNDIVVKVPGPLMRERVPYIDQGCAVPIAFRPGATRIMKRNSTGCVRFSASPRTSASLIVRGISSSADYLIPTFGLRRWRNTAIYRSAASKPHLQGNRNLSNCSSRKTDCNAAARHCATPT